MVSGGRHPKKDIADALIRAEKAGMIIAYDKNGHRWGWVICPLCLRQRAIPGTPRDPASRAKQIARFVRQHTERPRSCSSST